MKFTRALGLAALVSCSMSMIVACQGKDTKRAKSRLDRHGRSSKSANGSAATVNKLSSSGDQLCKPGVENAQFCDQVLVTVAKDGTIEGLDKDLINQGNGREISKAEAKVDGKAVTINLKNKQTRGDAQSLVIFASAQNAEADIKSLVEGKAAADVKNAKIEQMTIASTADLTALQARTDKMTGNIGIVFIGNDRVTLNKIIAQYKNDKKVSVTGFTDPNPDVVGIENFVLANFAGERLDLKYTLPYSAAKIKSDTLKIEIGGQLLKKESYKISDAKKTKGLEIRIVDRSVFKKYTDDMEISFELAD